MISSMMLATSAAWFETSLAAARSATNMRDYLQAFHAADAGLALCSRAVRAGSAPVVQTDTDEPAKPVAWKRQGAFEAAAFTPEATWPGSARPPQCLIETWRLKARPDTQAFLLTARGFGARPDTQVWLQLELVIDGDKVERHWRRVAARPF
jgi:Tfp pilus assembly protein PilX